MFEHPSRTFNEAEVAGRRRSGSGPGTIRAVLMRGGTSKGVFLHLDDLPPFGHVLDELLLKIMGSPDPMQIDGLGGTHSSTSKVIIVAPSDQLGIDVRYWFAQVGIEEPSVDWSGNCGNLTMAVGPFAIDEGLVAPVAPITEIHLLNENTGVEIVAKVQVEDGRVKEHGDLVVSGVPNSGAPIVTEFLSPGGAILGAVLPTGRTLDVISTPNGDFDVSIVDVTHPIAIVNGADFGIDVADSQPQVLNGDSELLAEVERLRAACAAYLRSSKATNIDSPAVPRLVFVAEPNEDTRKRDPDVDVLALGVSMGRIHHALPMTSALCLGAAVQITGTTANKVVQGTSDGRLSIRHPKGTVVVTSDVFVGSNGPEVRSVGVVRTARRLMSGVVHNRA